MVAQPCTYMRMLTLAAITGCSLDPHGLGSWPDLGAATQDTRGTAQADQGGAFAAGGAPGAGPGGKDGPGLGSEASAGSGEGTDAAQVEQTDARLEQRDIGAGPDAYVDVAMPTPMVGLEVTWTLKNQRCDVRSGVLMDSVVHFVAQGADIRTFDFPCSDYGATLPLAAGGYRLLTQLLTNDRYGHRSTLSDTGFMNVTVPGKIRIEFELRR